MEVVQLKNDNLQQVAAHAAAVLRAGGVVLYPTDTLYGLGADALSDNAVERIYDIKGREDKKPIHAIVTNLAMAGEYADIGIEAHALLEKFGGQITLIVRKRGIETGIAKGISTFGFRIPDNEFCIALAKHFGKPITATSANKAGEKPERSVQRILAQLTPDSYTSVLQKTAIENIDLVIDAGELPESKPSTVVDLSGAEPVILREGAISAALLHPPSH
ncbi:threonylcarbamoyl-AMP synthase [Candidatus Kaiserbacteria bacterium RIFCSPLOWO2_12_FULL_53_8]|uniref:L-threonylcarbamoyladenylate synthase n=2 Tax=Candidatus Kaiseribacteriota TaxID=1752734 RepID=A0A1F6CWT2_9BACT|nr:MAG: threonylcarbamoyl-AMP synthase [Candidatus Kaiserbacteria bacterium RIFCSPHIGHO2_01_FULL_53_29]OGG91654.1 MAG: threonylcarbamoyl-AMP synthase [Candidatus Kaiserbacteria bacterium RIFCSPLOWO2_12_FULL_53_8]